MHKMHCNDWPRTLLQQGAGTGCCLGEQAQFMIVLQCSAVCIHMLYYTIVRIRSFTANCLFTAGIRNKQGPPGQLCCAGNPIVSLYTREHCCLLVACLNYYVIISYYYYLSITKELSLPIIEHFTPQNLQMMKVVQMNHILCLQSIKRLLNHW